MGFTVKITFHGTVPLVPLDRNGLPASLDSGTKRACMLLPHYDPEQLEDLQPLVAYVRFPAAAYDRRRNQRSPFFPPAGRGAGLQHVYLDREYVTLEAKFARGSTTLRPNVTQPAASFPRNADRQSLYWLPTIERLVPNAGTIDPVFLQLPFTRTESPRLSARVDLANGILDTSGVTESAVTFIRSVSQQQSQVTIAREAVLTADVDGDSLVLRSQPLYRDRHDDADDLIFTPPAGMSQLDLVIGNEPDTDIYATPQEMDLIPTTEGAKEFGLYYMLSSQRIADIALPAGVNRGSPHQLCTVATMGGTT